MKKNKIVIERHGDDGWFFATVPGVRGLVAFGPTEDETLEGLKVAFKLMMNAAAETVRIGRQNWKKVHSDEFLFAA